MKTQLIYVEKKENMTTFNFFHEEWKYYGWVCPKTEEFKISRISCKNEKTEVLGWKYYEAQYNSYEECGECTENSCYNCPCARLEQAGWDYTDLVNFLTKIKLANELLEKEQIKKYENVINENLHEDLHLLIRGIKHSKTPEQIENLTRNFNWEWYPHDEIIAVCNHFSGLGNHGNWFNPFTAELDNPAKQAGKTNTELMVMLAHAVSTVSKKIELGDTNSPWGDFTY